MEEREKRIRAITRIYYLNPKIKEAIVNFAQGREVVPRYFEGFGRRPDIIQYPSDIDGLVKKGATSFHASEEIWENPLDLSSEITAAEMNNLRKGFDLIIDIDSTFLDISKILAKLILNALEEHGVKNYGIKYSGSRGFHIIVSGKAFPNEFDSVKMSEGFPEWPRAICEYLMNYVRRDFNKKTGEIMGDVNIVKQRTNAKEDKIKESLCPECGRPMKKGGLVVLKCPVCGTTIQRKDVKITKKRLKCVQPDCAGVLEIENTGDYLKCDSCENVSSISKIATSGRYKATYSDYAKEVVDYSSEMQEEYAGGFFGASDLVLVAPRHLFRMPYSLHEKTALASIVITKEEIEKFNPKKADPMNVQIMEFLPQNKEGEAKRLLIYALEWKKKRNIEEKKREEEKYIGARIENKVFEEIKSEDVREEMYPAAIKKLLKGLNEGRKRGLFVLITFLRALNYPPDYINKKVHEWNERNQPPLKEGYIRGQIEWHLKQKKKILPPNYSNESFYRDLGLIEKMPGEKNPIVEVKRALWKKQNRENIFK